jgi:predicted nucleotide-binding protein (sugar kinase/HSP70/actin superfamily)
VGIPRVLSMWSVHQFWIGFLTSLGVDERNIVFSSETSEAQFRRFGMGRVTVESCYPVKCVSGHYGELLYGQKHKLDLLLHPMHYNLPSFMRGHVMDTLTCPRDQAAPENVRAGFQKERDLFAESGIQYLTPLVSLGEPAVVPRQLYEALREALDLDPAETQAAAAAGYRALEAFEHRMRSASREVLAACARENKPCIMILARPYHMDPGIGHEVENPMQLEGISILWSHYLPIDEDLMQWLFGEEVRRGEIRHPFDLSDVWTNSYSNSTNEIMWSAKFAARMPWITCVLRLSSYECGMDQPTYTPSQRIVEASGTLYFRFGDLDATKPVGSLKIRAETILHYFGAYSDRIIRDKLARMPGGCPLLAEQGVP